MTGRKPEISDETWERAKKLRLDGASWERVARYVGAGVERTRYRIDPAWVEKRRDRFRGRPEGKPRKYTLSAGRLESWMPPEQYAQLLATIPHDQRSFTARLLGDPLPGRSALDQRGH
jgi:hypothetical protein